MIDTVSLALKQSEFSMLYGKLDVSLFHDEQWNKSTLEVFEWEYSSGKQKGFIYQKNPLNNYNLDRPYEPCYTLWKNRYSKPPEYELKIEFSIPKLLWGCNHFEVKETDFPEVLRLLQLRLRNVGICVDIEVLKKACVRRVDFVKNFFLKKDKSIIEFLKVFEKTDIHGRFKPTKISYPNGGEEFKIHCTNQEITLYDKKSEVRKQYQHFLRKNDLCDVIPTKAHALQDFINHPDNVIRFEVRLTKKYKLVRTLNQNGFFIPNTFEAIFKKKVCQKVLQSYFEKLVEGSELATTESLSPIETIPLIKSQFPNSKPLDILACFGASMIAKEVGIPGLKRIYKDSFGTSPRRILDRVKALKQTPKKNTHKDIKRFKKQISQFKPLYPSEETHTELLAISRQPKPHAFSLESFKVPEVDDDFIEL
jgi:hypothetical protein